MKVSGITMRPPFGSRACVATTASRVDVSRTGETIASTASDAAAALNDPRKFSVDGIVAGLNSNAARLTRGAISLSNSSHLLTMVGSYAVKPVALPPGREKLVKIGRA